MVGRKLAEGYFYRGLKVEKKSKGTSEEQEEKSVKQRKGEKKEKEDEKEKEKKGKKNVRSSGETLNRSCHTKTCLSGVL